jgi:hypothetical protein
LPEFSKPDPGDESAFGGMRSVASGIRTATGAQMNFPDRRFDL